MILYFMLPLTSWNVFKCLTSVVCSISSTLTFLTPSGLWKCCCSQWTVVVAHEIKTKWVVAELPKKVYEHQCWLSWLTVIGRFSDSTIDVMEMMDDDDKIDLELIVELIRHIVMKEDVSTECVFVSLWLCGCLCQVCLCLCGSVCMCFCLLHAHPECKWWLCVRGSEWTETEGV